MGLDCADATRRNKGPSFRSQQSQQTQNPMPCFRMLISIQLDARGRERNSGGSVALCDALATSPEIIQKMAHLHGNVLCPPEKDPKGGQRSFDQIDCSAGEKPRKEGPDKVR